MEADSTDEKGLPFRDLLRRIVSEARPEEVPVLDSMSDLDHSTARRMMRRPDHDGIGFGLPEVVVTVTPVLFVALDEAFRKIVGISVEGSVRGLVRRAFRRRKPDPVVPPLTDEQVAAVRAEVLRILAERGVAPEVNAAVGHSIERVSPRRTRTRSAGNAPDVTPY